MLERNAGTQPRLPSLDLLKGFEAAARLLSFTKAGEELHLTQSAVSRQMLELDSNNSFAYHWLSGHYALQGMLAEALAFAEKAYSLAPRNPQNVGLFAGALARTGDKSRGQELLENLGDGQAYGVPLGLALFHILCGEVDKAADWIERAVDQRHPGITIVRANPLFKAVLSSPRWPKLARMMNLPEAV